MGNILLAHESRTVRATLKSYLKPAHKVLEASDSDAAWHMLVLHNDINAVIAGPDLGMSTGLSLLERVRHNTLLRLKQMPFYFIGSETRIAELAEEATKAQANGFLHTGMQRQEVLDILHPAIGTLEPEADMMPPLKSKAAEPGAPSIKRTLKTGLIESAPLTPNLFESAVGRQYSVPGQKGAILCCAITNYPKLVKDLGQATAVSIASKLTKLAQTRIGSSDIISLYAPGVLIISTVGGTSAICERFAAQLKKNLSATKITVHGTPLALSIVSAYAAIPEDGALSGKELLELAKRRLLKTLQDATVAHKP